MKQLLLAAAAIASLGSSASAASFSTYYNGEGNAVINLEGEIVQGDRQRFRDIVISVNRQNKYVSGIRLNTGGGDLTEGYGIAADVIGAKIDTIVYRNSTCASACFLIFASGKQKWIDDGARIGVHSASNVDGKETVSSMAKTLEMVRIMKMLNAPASVIAKAATTEPGQMGWLTADEALAMGARWVNPNKPTASVSYNTPQAEQASYVNPYTASDSTWHRHWNWANNTARLQKEDYDEVGPSSECFSVKGANACVKQVAYFEKSGRYAVAVEITVDGSVGSREVCRSTYSTDNYRVCTDWATEKNEQQFRGRDGRWRTR